MLAIILDRDLEMEYNLKNKTLLKPETVSEWSAAVHAHLSEMTWEKK
jgi:hypothetical protein